MTEKNTGKKILVVEDERYLRTQLKELLTERGYDVETAGSRAEAEYMILNDRDISLYLLDVWLPDGDGFDLCRLIRKRTAGPVIFLTACDDEESVVKGLDMGGDDYVSKPFRTAELVSRIQANLRGRERQCLATVRESGGLRLDMGASTVYMDGKEILMSPAEYSLLTVLMENAGRIVRREILAEHVWGDPGAEIGDNTLSVTVSRLRRKIGAGYVETVRGFGYRFTGAVRECIE